VSRLLAGLLLCAVSATGAWQRMQSPHFELITDAGQSSGREVLRRMEQIRQLFEARTGRTNLTPLPIRVFAFRTEADFRPFMVNENAAGYFQSGSERDYIAMQVTGADLYRVVYHEYVHLLLRHANVPVPVWFNEGTAEVYSTTELAGKEVRIGDLIPAHLATLRSERMLDVATLLSVDHASPWYNEREKTGIFYAQSWALVHMLNFSPDYQPGMPNFLSLLFQGEEPTRCLQQAFGKSPTSVLNDLTAYVRRDRFAGVRFPAPKVTGIGKLVAENMRDPESGLALADLLLALHRTDRAAALLDKIQKERPNDPDVVAALADVALQKKEDAKARDLYRRAIELGSTSARLRYEYAMVLRELNASDTEILNALREGVRLDGSMFDAQYLLGYTLLRAADYAGAIRHLKTASELQPFRSAVWEHLALACHYAHRKPEARDAARRFRKLASTPEEIERADGLLKQVESSTDSIVQATPTPRRSVDALPSTRIEGTPRQVDCLGSKARLQIQSVDGRRVFLLVRDPANVVLRNAGALWTEFTCGLLPGGGRRVSVDYRGNPDEVWRTSGDVVAMEFH